MLRLPKTDPTATSRYPYNEVAHSLDDCYLANALPERDRQPSQFSKSAIGCLLVCLVLLLDLAAFCPALHELVHKGATRPGHECAVTTFTHGKADITTVHVSVCGPAVVLEAMPPIEFPVFGTSVDYLPPGRAPPVIPAFS
jgi:hypothetical protein